MDNDRIIPSRESIEKAGYGNDYPRVEKLVEELEGINEQKIREIAGVLRRMVYKLGLYGGYDGLQGMAIKKSNWEQTEVDRIPCPWEQETAKEYGDRMKLWRTLFSLIGLDSMDDPRPLRKIMGEIRARFRSEMDSDRIGDDFFDEHGKFLYDKTPIDDNTPLDLLLDILYFTEQSKDTHDPEDMGRLRELIHKILITRLISKDANFIEVGTRYFSSQNYKTIIDAATPPLSEGRIGRKAANQILASAALDVSTSEFDEAFAKKMNLRGGVRELHEITENAFHPIESRHLGSDLLYELIYSNPSLEPIMAGGYKRHESTEEDEAFFKDISEKIDRAKFPAHIERQLSNFYEKILKDWGDRPFIVRSSAELEDQHGASFAGMYDSLICMGSFNEFLSAIKTIYKSIFSPKVLAYRREHGLLSADEQMGLLVQPLRGEWYGDYFFPSISGVGLSIAPQSPGPNPERGSMTLALGLGEKVVQGGGRLVLFDDPKLNPVRSGQKGHQQEEAIAVHRTRGQITIPMEKLLEQSTFAAKSPAFKDIFVNGYGQPISSTFMGIDTKNILATFGPMTEGRPAIFPLIVEYAIRKIEHLLGWDCDIEFTAEKNKKDGYEFTLLQCRPQNFAKNLKPARVPENVPSEDILVKTECSLSNGYVRDVPFMLYISPDVYGNESSDSLTHDEMNQLRDWISLVNSKLAPERGKKGEYVVIAPGRWGDNSASELGIYVRSQDYCNCAGFVEVVGTGHWRVTPSAGSHDFQLIVEQGMLTFSTDLSANGSFLNRERLDEADNHIEKLLETEVPPRIKRWLRLIRATSLAGSDSEEEWGFNIAMNNISNDRYGRKAGLYLAQTGKRKPVIIKH